MLSRRIAGDSQCPGWAYVDTKKGFAAACLAAGLEGFTFHDLRHTFATRLKEAGVDPVTRRDLLGHASTVMTDSYTHSAAETKQAAVDSIYHSGELSPLHFPAKAEQPPRGRAVHNPLCYKIFFATPPDRDRTLSKPDKLETSDLELATVEAREHLNVDVRGSSRDSTSGRRVNKG